MPRLTGLIAAEELSRREFDMYSQSKVFEDGVRMSHPSSLLLCSLSVLFFSVLREVRHKRQSGAGMYA